MMLLPFLALALAAPAQPEPTYLLTYDHGGLVLWGRDLFVERLRDATAWLDRYPSFKIGLDNEAYTYDYLAEHEPETLNELRGYLTKYKGRFGIGTCTYGQPLSEFINEESNIRQIGYALRADREHLGVAPDVYLMSEHANHSQIPQILAGFGFRGSIMRTHFMMYGYNPTYRVPVGWWVGLDGSRVPTVPTYEGEGASFGTTTNDNWILTRFPGPESNTSLEEWRSKFPGIRPLIATRADDAVLRKEELVRRYEGNPEFRWVLLEEIFPAFPKPKAELKTAPNDFKVRMPWGYCGNEIWNLNREAEVSVLTAERLAALAHLVGGDAREADLRQAWKDLLVAQHHDVQICGLLPEARKFLPASIARSKQVAQDSLRYVASRMKTGGSAQITLFNPLSWRRTEWTEATVEMAPGAAREIEMRRGSRKAPCAVLSTERHPDGSLKSARIAFPADLPGLGFAAYSVVPAQAAPAASAWRPADGATITTPWIEARLATGGGLGALVDRKTGRALVKPGQRSGFFAGVIEGRPLESRGRWELLEHPGGAPWSVARETGEIGSIPYTLDMTFRDDLPRIDCHVKFHFAGQRIGRLSEDKRDGRSGFLHEEKLRFKLFPETGEKPVGVRDLPFAVAETPDPYVEGNYWAAIAGTEGGLAVFNRGAMSSVRESDGGFSVPLAFAMYYVWGTRMLDGDFAYDFALCPFDGAWQKADLHRRALAYEFPLAAEGTAPGNGSLGSDVRLIDAGSPNVLLTALYTENGATYARLFEHRGAPANAGIRCLSGPARLMETDLAGNAKGAVNGSLAFRPWQFKTVRIDAGN